LGEWFTGWLGEGDGRVADLALCQATIFSFGQVLLEPLVDGPGLNRRQTVLGQILQKGLPFILERQSCDSLLVHSVLLSLGVIIAHPKLEDKCPYMESGFLNES
jgi:hypothetical protein